jgi:hypothetical protein
MNPHNGEFALAAKDDLTRESWWLDKDRQSFYAEVRNREHIWLRRGRQTVSMTEAWLLDEKPSRGKR